MTASTVFTNNRSQAVRLPADMRFPEHVKKVDVRAVGAERIITPVNSAWDSFFVNGPTVSDDFLNKRGNQQQSERDKL